LGMGESMRRLVIAWLGLLALLIAQPALGQSVNVRLQIYNPASAARVSEPVTSGLPLPRSLNLTQASRLRLVDAAGRAIPAQFTSLARWGGAPASGTAPIRWVLADFQTSVGAGQTTTCYLRDGGPGPQPARPLRVSQTASHLIVNTGAAEFRLSRADGGLTGPGLISPLVGRARSGGREYTTTGPVSLSLTLQGPMRVSVKVKGAYRAGGARLVNYTSRYWFYAGQSLVRLFHTVENANLGRLGPEGQLTCFDIGSAGSVRLSDLSLILPARLGSGLSYQAGGQGAAATGGLSADLVLYQDSSGTPYWNRFPTLRGWEGQVLDARPRMQSYVSFRGYRISLGGSVVNRGNQAAGWLRVSGSGGSLTVGVRDFWRNFPKALRARSGGTLEIGLFPDEFGPADYAFTLRAGEHKTHEVYLSFGGGAPASLEGLSARAPAEWYVSSGALGRTALPDRAAWPEHERYIGYQLDTSPNHAGFEQYFPNLPAAIERTDFYGIFDYGDWPLDYEGYHAAPLNCKYDNDLGMWLQWARGGDRRWFRLAEAADRHFADIDILHNLHSPRHWGDGIAFGHSQHDEDGFTNPHRNVNSGSTDTAFGLPGLLLAYYLTGYEKAWEAALELADCVEWRLRNDSHLARSFPGSTGEGYALDEGLYEAGCRLAANSLMIVAAAYRATGTRRYLAAADALVNWARSSSQPYINGPNGQSRMMRPWMLNMYLRALADYLDLRQEYGLADAFNGRGSYLAYANWLRTYPWIELAPIASGGRAAYPYEWWFDGRRGVAGEDNDNGDASVNNWLLLGADALAYAYGLSNEGDYLNRAARLFMAGSHDPWYVGDPNIYAEAKETVNSITFGHRFLYYWARR